MIKKYFSVLTFIFALVIVLPVSAAVTTKLTVKNEIARCIQAATNKQKSAIATTLKTYNTNSRAAKAKKNKAALKQARIDYLKTLDEAKNNFKTDRAACQPVISLKFFDNRSHNSPEDNPTNLASQLSGNRCQGKGTKEFGTAPMNIPDIGAIVPLGLMVDAHVTPIDHIYFNPKIFNSARDTYPVFAIADGTIVSIQHRTSFVGNTSNQQQKTDEYRAVVEYSCTFYSYYDLITSLSPAILAQAGDIDTKGYSNNIRIPIKEGQEIGKIGGQTLDFAVWNEDVILKGFVVPQHYQAEGWKIHTDNPFIHFKKSIQDQLLALDQRTAEPREGKIDYDIDGKLVGTWFKEGTGGYDYAQANREGFWKTQLSIVYDYLDPTQIRISTGDYSGQAMQFGVKGNAPDPAMIEKSNGKVVYELVPYDYSTAEGTHWDRFSVIKDVQARNSSQPVGVALIQMIENRKIKFEVFPGKNAKEVTDFDANAIIYER